ncbi:unnamed protein product [Heterosigma akashiwo]
MQKRAHQAISTYLGNQPIVSEQTLKEELEFLISNQKKEGVVVLGSGLQYKVLKSGPEEGLKPGPRTPCSVHYEGRREY